MPYPSYLYPVPPYPLQAPALLHDASSTATPPITPTRPKVKCLPTKVRKTVTKKRVRFAPTITIASHPTPSSHEVSQRWYQSSDYVAMEQSRKATLLALLQVQGNLLALDPNQHTLVGMEEQITRQQVLTRKLQTVQYSRLMLEQWATNERQTSLLGGQDNVHAEDSLKSMANMLSRQAHQRAHARAFAVLNNSNHHHHHHLLHTTTSGRL